MKSHSFSPLIDTTSQRIHRGAASLFSSSWITPSIILIVAAFLRLYNLGTPSLWLDETHTWWLTRLPWPHLFQALREIGVHPPFYFTIEKTFTVIVGDTEFGLRLLSVLVDLATVYVVMRIGREVGGRTGLLLAGWFWAFHPMVIWYAREARPYSLAMLFSACAVYVYLVLQDRSSRAMWIIGSITLALGMLTHYFVWLVGFILTLIALSEFQEKPMIFRRWVLLFIVASIPVASWLIWYFQLPNPSLGIAWIAQPKFQDVWITLWNLLSGFGGAFSFATSIFGILVACLIVVACFTKVKKRLVGNILLIGVALPLMGIWLVSQRRPVYMDRYFSVLLPFMALLVGIGGEQVQEKFKLHLQRFSDGTLVKLLPLVPLIIGLVAGFQIHESHIYAKENWRALAEQLTKTQVSKQPVWLTDPEVITAVRYYLGESFEHWERATSAKCQGSCWWILRRPYTATHAFSSVVSSPAHPDYIQTPDGCSIEHYWKDESGLELWDVICEDI
jgi:mannosyltransferase